MKICSTHKILCNQWKHFYICDHIKFLGIKAYNKYIVTNSFCKPLAKSSIEYYLFNS